MQFQSDCHRKLIETTQHPKGSALSKLFLSAIWSPL